MRQYRHVAIDITTIKTLFALSCNVCSYRGCDEKLTDSSWEAVNADIAHICGDKPSAPRHDANMTPAERDSFDNLMLLCPNCHRRIDRLEPDQHTPEMLREMKARHIEHCRESMEWASDSQLDRFALLALGESAGPRPRLIVRRGPDDPNSVEVVNVGDAEAIGVGIETPDQVGDRRYVQLAEVSPGALGPGEVWRAGQYLLTSGISEKPFRVYWSDEAGEEHETVVDLIQL